MRYSVFLFFCALLPFQFALNPTEGVDLAVARIAVLLMFLMWLVLAAGKKYPLPKKDKLVGLLVIFLLLASASVYFSTNIPWSLRKLIFLLSLFPVYLVAVSVLDTKAKIRTAIAALVAGAAAAAFFGIIQFGAQFVFGIGPVYSFLARYIAPFFLGHSFSQAVLSYPSWLVNSGGTTYMRAVATFPDPHMFSYYLGMLAPWSIALWATTVSHKKAFLFSSIIIVLADIFTFARGGYLALLVSAVVILPLVSREAAKKLLAGAALFICLFALMPHNPVTGRFASSFDMQEGSNQGRLANWRQALSIIAAHPLGVGIGTYSLAVDSNADYREPIYAHNLYLDIAAELGMPAALVFVSLLFFSFGSFWKNAPGHPLFVAGAASLSVFSVHSLVETPLYSVHVLPLILIIMAISANIDKYEQVRNN